MQEEIVKEKKAQTSYDEVPYVSNAYSYASPEHYYSVGKLFGLDPVHPSKARVLDLGCASGGNIIGYGARYPKSELIGVDLSSVQVERGQNQIKDLGLKNVELKAMSIMDIDSSFGKFDYIICHGVFAWIPKEVQDKILKVCEENLADKGIAHISYNALPGWNVANSFREMMSYHSASFGTPQEKIQQSKALIDFVKESLSETKSPYSEILNSEAAHIASSNDSYILHEYIEKGNSEFYFSDFMKEASKHNLSYLADSIVSTMYIGNLPEKAVQKLSEITDIIRVEQYMDFVTNRRFRNTLLCKNTQAIKRNVGASIMDDAYVKMQVTPKAPKEKIDFSKADVKASFDLTNGMNCETTSAVNAAMFYVLSEQVKRISMSDLFKEVKKLCPKFDAKIHVPELQTQLVEFIFKGIAKVSFTESHFVDKLSNKPKMFEVARYQALNNASYIVNCENDSLALDDATRFVLSKADGTNTKSDIAKEFALWLQNNEKAVLQDGKTVTDEKLRTKLLEDIVERSLQFALTCGLLVE